MTDEMTADELAEWLSPAELDAHTYLRKVYQGVLPPDNQRMRAAAIAIEYERPSLRATAILTDGSFAQRLDRAIARSNGNVKVIDAQPLKEGESAPAKVPPTVEIKPRLPTVPDRRYRRL